MKNIELRKIIRNSIISTIIVVFIVLYFLFLIQIYIIPNKFKISIVLLFGFAIIISGIFYFFLKVDSSNNLVVKVKILNENAIKTILIGLMIITVFIPPISFSDFIISWDQISFLNYLRAVIFFIGATFIPGSCIFNLLLPESTIHKKLNVEPFLVKLTIYPILSLTGLGSATLALNFFGFTRVPIFLFLFFSILAFYIIELFIKRKRKKTLFETTELTISRYTLLIFIIGLGIIIIALGIILSSHRYIISGDRWRCISPALLIGTGDFSTSPDIYAKYWSCISFGLSVLCGIPYINTNVLLFSLMYLSVTSVYLFVKAILNNLDEKFCVLASIFIAILFSPRLILVQFSYHSYAFYSLFIYLSLFFIVAKSDQLESRKKRYDENTILLVLSALFLVQSFMTYMITTLMGILLIFLYGLFSSNFKLYFKKLLIFFRYFIIIFLIFDLISSFFFSLYALVFVSGFSAIPLVFFSAELSVRSILAALLFYTIVSIFYFLLVIIYKFSNNLSALIKKTKLKIIIILKKKYASFLLFFFMYILILFCVLIASLDLTFGERLLFQTKEGSLEDNFPIFYLSTLFSAIGFVGMAGIVLSHKSFKENKNRFFFLLSWTLIIIGLASSLILLRWVQYPSSLISEIPEDYSFYMKYWFSRTWYYSIIPLSIFTAIGLVRIIQNSKLRTLFKIKTRGWFKVKTYKDINLIAPLSLIALFLFITFSNPITRTMYWDNYYAVSDEEAQIIGWTSKNLPKDSQIIIDNNHIWILKFVIQNDVYLFQTSYYSVEMANAINNYELGEIDLYKWHVDTGNYGDIKLVLEKDDRMNIINMYDKSTSGNISMSKDFLASQMNGTIAFYLKIESNEVDKEAGINIKLFGANSSEGIDFYLDHGNYYIYNYSKGSYDSMVTNYELNEWNYYVINFDCDSGYWNVSINGEQIEGELGNAQFKMKGAPLNLSRVVISTTKNAKDYLVFFDNFYYSWEPNDLDNDVYNRIIVNDITKLIYHLNSENMNYFIIHNNSFSQYEELMDYFYNKKLYEYGEISIYTSI